MNWNNNSESVINQLRENIKNCKIMHIQQAQQFHSFYTKLTISGIVIGPMASILSAINQVIHPEQNHFISILEIILGFLSGIVVAIIKFGKYDELMNSNQAVATKYTTLEANIIRQMCLCRENRISPEIYLEWVETKYGEILSTAPIITKNTYDNFNKNCNHNGYTMTINKDSLQEIISQQNDGTPNDETPNVGTLNDETPNVGTPNDENPPIKTVKKGTVTMSKLPQINQYSDKMLQYELKRMLNMR